MKRTARWAFKIWVLGLVWAGLMGGSIPVKGAEPHRLFFPIVHKTVPQVEAGPPRFGTSVYMTTNNPNAYYNLGCAQGKRDLGLAGTQDSLVVLAFGKPVKIGEVYGVSLFGVAPTTTAVLETLIPMYAMGYVDCAGDDTQSTVTLGLGTSNYGDMVRYSSGIAWNNFVDHVNRWLKDNNYYHRVAAVGAIDIELGWNPPDVTRTWVSGYDDGNLYPYLNFGDANSCPTRFFPHWDCKDPWTKEDLWYVSYGVGAAFPLPLIYATDTGNAQQWALMSLWAAQNKGAPMQIQGVMTQWQACQQYPSGCGPGLDNRPEEGWQQLYDELARDARTKQELRWSTDILWWRSSLTIQADAMQMRTTGAAEQAAAIETVLAQADLDAGVRSSLEEKQELWLRMAREQGISARLAETEGMRAPEVPMVEAAPFPTGIFEGDEGWFRSGQAQITRRWQGMSQDGYLQVMVGADGEDLTRGVVVILRYDPERVLVDLRKELGPPGSGPYALEGLEGGELVIRAADGAELRLNILQDGAILP